MRSKVKLYEPLEDRRMMSATSTVPITLAATTVANSLVVNFNSTTSTYSITGRSGGPLSVVAAALDVTLQGDGGNVSLTVNGGKVTLMNDPGSDQTELALTLNIASLVFATSGHIHSLNVGAGSSAAVAVNGQDVLVLDQLSNSGQIDLNNNDMIVHNGNLANIAGQIGTGRRSIFSSVAAGSTTLPMELGYELNNNGAGSTLMGTFAGQSVGANDVLVKFTYAGDTNLDGTVDATDAQALVNGYLNHLTGWNNGDFDNNGSIDGSDFSLLDGARALQMATLAPATSGQTYSLALPTRGFNSTSVWTINWGDGAVDHLTGAPGLATHRYWATASSTMYITVAGMNPNGTTLAIPRRAVTIFGSGGVPLPDFHVPGPSSNPTLPGGMNVFAPSLSTASIANGAPVIATANVTAGPNESITLTGANFSAYGDGSDTRFLVYAQTDTTNGTRIDALVQDVTATGAIITLSSNEPADAMYLIWPENANGIGAPIAVNQTTSTWLSNGGNATAGQTMSVYGDNLRGIGGQSWVYLEPAGGGNAVWVPVTSVNPYKVDFTVPSGLSGQFLVWVNNGLGGNYGWAAPLPMTVSAATVWSSNQIVNVKSFGATGNGTTNDAAAVASAVASLHAGSTLYFPAGTYVMGNQQLLLFGNVRVIGDSPTLSKLIFSGSAAHTSSGSFEIGFGDSAGNGAEIDSLGIAYQGTDSASALLYVRYSANLVLNNLSLFGNTLAPLDIQGSSQVRLTNSSLEGVEVNAIQTHDVTVDNVSFHEAHSAEAAINVLAGHDLSITNCTVANQDESNNMSWDGWGQGRLLEDNLFWGSIYNQYVAGNVTQNLGGPSGLASQNGSFNDGEQINIEAAQDQVSGSATAASATTVTMPASSFNPEHHAGWSASGIGIGLCLTITDGTGLGQMRVVTGVQFSPDGQSVTLTLDRAFALQPDLASTIVVSGTAYNCAFYQNTLQLQSGANGLDAEGAGTGFEIFTGGYNLIFDSNTTVNVSAGVFAISYLVENPCFFIQITNNTFVSSQREGLELINGAGITSSGVGDVVRNNTIVSTPIGIALSQNSVETTMRFAVIEHNTVNNCTVGLQAGNDPDTFVYQNTFSSGSKGVQFQGPTETILLQGNTWQNIDQAYVAAGNVSPVLSLPLRSFTLDTAVSGDESATVSIFNDGIAATDWIASSSAPWLSLSSYAGVTPDGSSSDQTLTADPTGLVPGQYSAIVTINSGILTEKMTVWLTVV